MTMVWQGQLRRWQHCSLSPSGQQRLMLLALHGTWRFSYGVALLTRSLQALCTITCVMSQFFGQISRIIINS